MSLFFPFKYLEIKLKLKKKNQKEDACKENSPLQGTNDVFFTSKFHCSTEDTVMISLPKKKEQIV